MPTTMILRFRDLVADTIIEHRNLIEQYGYVWWGWWNKPDEKIPRHTFAKFQEIIRDKSHLWVYLIDSGKRNLYKAQLVEIDVSQNEEVKECPEPEKAPGYYSTAKYKVWFRFTNIKDISSEEIKNWSYDEVAEFLDDPSSTRFQDKRIFDIQEMLNRRHRTIYFIKPYDKKQHQDYLIELVPSIGRGSFITPPRDQRVQVVPSADFKDFMTTPIYRDSTYIIHLSDLHFSAKHHGFAIKADRARRSLVTIIEDDIKKVGNNKPPAIVIISGDFTWQGRPEEFDLASDFINDLQSISGLEPEHFVFVPGNHDIQWSEQTGDDYERKKPVTIPQDEAERNYREFFDKIFEFSSNEFLTIGRRYILGNYIALDVIGLNSCRLEQRHFSGYGFVGIEQINKSAEGMNWEPERNRVRYRMLVLHHHIIPVTPQEEIDTYDRIYSLTLDCGQLIYKALELDVDLIAHGHMHQPFASSVSRAARGSAFSHSRTFAIHGAGSAGVKREHVGAIGKNSYSVYYFDEEVINVKIRSWSENVQGFEDDWQCHFCRNPEGGMKLT